jgi:hypothetical protein
MKFTQLNKDWNAGPNAPEPSLMVNERSIILEFYLNHFIFEQFKEDDKGRLTFNNCHKYSFNTMNDEGYYKGQYRYKYTELPWGEFYQLETNWQNDFPQDSIMLISHIDKQNLKHFIFFMRDNTLECIAENYEFQLLESPLKTVTKIT